MAKNTTKTNGTTETTLTAEQKYQAAKTEYAQTAAAVEAAHEAVKLANTAERKAIAEVVKTAPAVIEAHKAVTEALKIERAALAAMNLNAKLFASAAAARDAQG